MVPVSWHLSAKSRSSTPISKMLTSRADPTPTASFSRLPTPVQLKPSKGRLPTTSIWATTPAKTLTDLLFFGLKPTSLLFPTRSSNSRPWTPNKNRTWKTPSNNIARAITAETTAPTTPTRSTSTPKSTKSYSTSSTTTTWSMWPNPAVTAAKKCRYPPPSIAPAPATPPPAPPAASSPSTSATSSRSWRSTTCSATTATSTKLCSGKVRLRLSSRMCSSPRLPKSTSRICRFSGTC